MRQRTAFGSGYTIHARREPTRYGPESGKAYAGCKQELARIRQTYLDEVSQAGLARLARERRANPGKPWDQIRPRITVRVEARLDEAWREYVKQRTALFMRMRKAAKRDTAAIDDAWERGQPPPFELCETPREAAQRYGVTE